jgi:hypothetical protein
MGFSRKINAVDRIRKVIQDDRAGEGPPSFKQGAGRMRPGFANLLTEEEKYD